MADTVLIPDHLPDIRYWLRTHPLLQPLNAGRVFFRIPDQANIGGWPVMRIYDLSGGIEETGGEAALSTFHVGIECWHNKDSGYPAVRQLAAAVKSALFQIIPGSLINPSGQTRVRNASTLNVIDSPDPDTGWPRKVLDTRWSLLPL